MPVRKLVLRITSGPDGLVAEVLYSPGGQHGRIPFVPPPTATELARLATAVATATRRAGQRHLHPHGESLGADSDPVAPDLLQIGRRLSDALFQGPIAEALHRGLGSDDGTRDDPLRIEIRIDPTLDQAPALHALPWELLIAPRRHRPLALSRWTPVVRYLEVPRPDRPPPLPDSLRLLVVAPRPRGADALDQDLELRQMRDAWGGRKRVTIEILQPPTLDALRDALRSRPPHAVHFMGHGRFDEQQGQGELLFEHPDGTADRVAAETLAGQIEDFAEQIRIVVLNACQSGRGGARPARAATGVAAALVEAGIPAVVAMQLPITDRAAVVFGRALYDRLAEGEAVDVAVAEGRQAIRRRLRGSPEWMTPALFLRAGDGRLFARPGAPPGARPGTGPGAHPEAGPVAGESGARADPEPGAGGSARARGLRSLRILPVGLVLLLVSVVLVGGGMILSGGGGNRPDPGAEPAEAGLSTPESASEVTERAAGERTSGEPGSAAREPSRRPVEEPEGPEPTSAAAGTAGDDHEAADDSDGKRGDSPTAPVIHRLEVGETVYLPEAAAVVTFDYVTVAGHELARLTVSPDGGETVPRSVVGPGTVEVPSGDRTVRIEVVGLDDARRSITLRATSVRDRS